MNWRLSPKVDLRNERVPDEDADRQSRTATEILHRLDNQPGVVLADEVGMGKTYVALAVAVSVLEATKRRRPVVVMVPVAELTPTALPRTSPKLNDPSELTVVSILTLVLPRACCRLSSVVGTTDPASAPRIFPVPLFTLFSPARQEPCA